MTEYESDPQRRPAPSDADPASPELPGAERAQSDPAEPTEALRVAGAPESRPGSPSDSASASDGGHAAAEAARDGGSATPSAPPYPQAGQPQAGPYPAARQPGAPFHPGQQGPWAGPQPGRPGPGTGNPGSSQPGYPAAPQLGYHAANQPGYPSAAQSGYPSTSQSGYPGAQSGYPAPAQSGYPGSSQSGYPATAQSGYPSAQPGYPGAGYPGQPAAPWAPAPQSGPRPGRIAKFAGAGVAVFALMLGSGVAGGALVHALDSDGGVTRTYSAAPVINGADLPKIAAAVQDSVVSIATDSGEGSGVILSADGFVLTNNHVVASADNVRVIFANGTIAQAEIVGTDPKTDLAVLKAGGVRDLKAATFGDSDAMQVGDQVLALGSPLGLQGSVTAGILSARDRTISAGSQQEPGRGASSISGLLQTDAPINPGNSGGALVNTRGEVIGINTAIATSGQSSGNIGVGFAIPSNKAKDVAGKLQRGEKVSHPSLGVSVNAAPGGGALVAAVSPGSAAERAGLQRGDVIIRFGDKVINDSTDLVGAVQAGKVGDRVEVTYQRNGAEASVVVTLAEAS
ncbi:putative serine protease PepD [Micromonospora nigra]|uniref:Putative serine protease PepD n=1 Tax=Micromonospora nigra TaxID=145857 RepID=A0A1C6RP81_9ACTN|nr:trypsin-like peptidase domain-containing protein [Micromonospora nigra]SCL18863.1 putative serine protease PepD [Micromonospora nigra]